MASAVTLDMINAGVAELLGSGLLRPDVDADKDAVRLMTAVARIYMRMDQSRPSTMTREGEWFDPAKVGQTTWLLPGGK